MATNRSGHRPGGGIASRVNVQPSVRTGTGSYGTNPGGVGQLGQKQGSHITRHSDSDYRGDPLHSGRSFQPVPFGNEVALNVGKGGCGTGRTIYKTDNWRPLKRLPRLTGGSDDGGPGAQQGC